MSNQLTDGGGGDMLGVTDDSEFVDVQRALYTTYSNRVTTGIKKRSSNTTEH
jgi:hypothetical protein